MLHVSADELLGLTQEVMDERKAYFDSEYFEFWKKEDHEADYLIAKQAVEEYPGEFKYWHWLGSVEYYISFDRQDQNEFIGMMDSSIKHNLMVYENCQEEELKNTSLWTVICAYRYSGRTEQAKTYAQLYPQSHPTNRDDAMAMCLEGEELLLLQQRLIADALSNLCSKLDKLWHFADPSDPRCRAAVAAEKQIIEAVITDGNTLSFSGFLYGVHEKLADIALAEHDYEAAVAELKNAMKYAVNCDDIRVSGRQYYSCPILDHYDYDYSSCREISSEAERLRENLAKKEKYEPLRDREDFKELFSA